MSIFSRLRPLVFALVIAANGPALIAQKTTAAQENAVTEAVSWSAGIPYTYDGAGNVRKIGNDAFTYDHAGRVITANVNGIPRDYSYDAFGNRTGCRQWAGTSSLAECQKGKAIDADQNKNRVKDVGYDEAGNVTALDGHQYAYDALNMMKRDAVGTQANEFLYTADDERIAVYNVGASWKWAIRDENGKVLREFTSSNGPNGVGTASWQWVRDNVWRDTFLLASRQPQNQTTTTYYYHVDHLGTPRRITDVNDRIVGSHDYFAFGPDVSGGTIEPSPTALKYTGHERDSWGSLFGTLDYMHARYYDPELGRFSSVDPVLGVPGKPQSWNRYAYVLDSPIDYADPDGRQFGGLINMGRAYAMAEEYIKDEAKIPDTQDLPEWLVWKVLQNMGSGPTPIGPNPGVSMTGVNFIKQHEGFFKNLYLDTGGHCTIGYGHLVNYGACSPAANQQFGAGINEQQGSTLLAGDIRKDTSKPLSLIGRALSQAQVDAIAALSFNIGPGAFRRSSILVALNDNNLGQMSVNWLKFNRSGGKYTRGLYNRRVAELQLFWRP